MVMFEGDVAMFIGGDMSLCGLCEAVVYFFGWGRRQVFGVGFVDMMVLGAW